MKIKKGDWFKCYRSFKDPNVSTIILYRAGLYYKSEQDQSITDEKLGKDHCWDTKEAEKYFQKLYTLQDLKDGKCAVENNGELIELKLILSHAFGCDYIAGASNYYYKGDNDPLGWSDSTKLPTQSIEDFLVQIENKETIKDMKTIFKVGDQVFDYKYGWGVVGTSTELGLNVKFKGQDVGVSYFPSGNQATYGLSSLSFTEYNLITGGFSQERPLPDIKRGTLVYVKAGHLWLMRYFSHFIDNRGIRVFDSQHKSGETTGYREYSLTNPLEEK